MSRNLFYRPRRPSRVSETAHSNNNGYGGGRRCSVQERKPPTILAPRHSDILRPRHSVYNKLKPDDPDKVVDIESQDEQVGYEFSTTQIKEFRKVFNAFDRDGNDSIGTEELGPVLNALGYSPSDLDIQKVLSRFDADHSGDLSFEEYLALMAVWVEEDETQIIEAFKVFDKSGDGFVTITELKRALCRFGEKFSEEEADEFFALIDVNKDGIINYEEFVKYMLSEINRGPPPRQVKT
ncbi:uncharacterized protein LOC134817069 isoform X8 [Bolinopsis microptera]|uniref:uncharacterized protein LOC134817069 isoform X8 n=1 Tax=Bolinopsis microptera TaxID=2820187 RepID=UPI003079E9BF